MLSSISGRNITASATIVQLATAPISCSDSKSTASTEPNSKCSNSTLLPPKLTKITPIARLLK